MTKKQQQILRFSKIIILIVIIMVLVFTGCVLFTFNRQGNEPTSIITAFFAFMTGEVLALAKLKLTEIETESGSRKKEEKEKKEK